MHFGASQTGLRPAPPKEVEEGIDKQGQRESPSRSLIVPTTFVLVLVQVGRLKQVHCSVMNPIIAR